MPARQPAILPPPLSEKRFMAQVVTLARLMGFRVYHSWTSIHSAAGFPDLVLTRRPRVIFAELKRDGKHPTEAQQAWLDELRACGQEAYLWRPADWDEIEKVLR